MIIYFFASEVMLSSFDVFMAKEVLHKHDIFDVEYVESQCVSIISGCKFEVFLKKRLEGSGCDFVERFGKVLWSEVKNLMFDGNDSVGLFSFLFDGDENICEIFIGFLELELKTFTCAASNRKEN